MKEVVVPPQMPEVVEGPVIFLAGPIQGAADWQAEAIKYLSKSDQKFVIASPRRSDYDINSDAQYAEQVDWESHWLDIAGDCQGVILFWCAKEAEHNCARSYAQTTRAEYGEWVLGKKAEGQPGAVRVAIGIEKGYTGAKYYRHRLKRHQEKGKLLDVKIFDDLYATCDEALRLLPK
jgi:hypothetical protein